jgi:hypothetical protein
MMRLCESHHSRVESTPGARKGRCYNSFRFVEKPNGIIF